MLDDRHEETKACERVDGAEMQVAFARNDAGIAKLAAILRKRPWAFAAVRFIKKARTRIGFLLAVWCLAEGVYFRERPFALHQPNAYVVIGLILIA